MNEAHRYLINIILYIYVLFMAERFAKIRATLQGKQEERLPFFSFAFPESFKKRFQKEYENFLKNTEILTTPFDVHATLQHLLVLQLSSKSNDSLLNEPSNKTNIMDFTSTNSEGSILKSTKLSAMAKNRATSLFNIIQHNRSCADAYIEPHWCACLNWEPLNMTSDTEKGISLKAASRIINVINEFTQSYRFKCALLQLKRINWVSRLKPHKELLSFLNAKDEDGFIPKMRNNPVLFEELYQLQIQVIPGNGLFEASVTYNKSAREMYVGLSQVSRINKYGSQANCILKKNPDLRKYCYCYEPNLSYIYGDNS